MKTLLKTFGLGLSTGLAVAAPIKHQTDAGMDALTGYKNQLKHAVFERFNITEKPQNVMLEPATVDDLIQDAANAYNVNPQIIGAVIKAESGFNPNAESPKGAIGLMQIMPATGLRFCGLEKHELWLPKNNVDCGVYYLADLLKRHNLTNAMREYNGGPKCVKYRCRESENYAQKVTANILEQVDVTNNKKGR